MTKPARVTRLIRALALSCAIEQEIGCPHQDTTKRLAALRSLQAQNSAELSRQDHRRLWSEVTKVLSDMAEIMVNV